ncbi:hypothetical protein [Globicatella sp. HMSC072A10]|uniref:hypothetical protein n=1 Tax=Globicatella sp. HMSC072A10 TaxID=1739315 RepID=UPI0008D7969B|nr:hypothetical protein [Globicatella sp. HMSC072A10]OFK59293.1 hypothetical protein HMPREF2811_04665 [Globicatella sp. HMSC072A10]
MKGLFKILNELFDMVMLNIIFILSCLPLITIPISWIALVLMEMESEGIYGYVFQDYIKYWKKVMKPVMKVMFLGIVVLLLIFGMNVVFPLTILKQVQFIVGLILLLFILLMPLTNGKLQLENKDLLTVSLFLMTNFPLKVVFLLFINVLCLFLSVTTYLGFYISLSIFVLIGFVILAKFNAKLLTNIQNSIEIEEVKPSDSDNKL